MTAQKKYQLARKLSRRPMTQAEIENYCTKGPSMDIQRELNALCQEGFLRMVTKPRNVGGYLVYRPDDVYEITDKGRDFLRSEIVYRRRFAITQAIAIAALVVSIFTLIASLVGLI